MAQKLFRIPLTNEPQSFEITLLGRAYRVINRWNSALNAWQMCWGDAVTRQPIITCMPLVTGTDLFSQYRHLGIPGKLFCYTEGNADEVPTLDGLGKDSQVYFVVEEA